MFGRKPYALASVSVSKIFVMNMIHFDKLLKRYKNHVVLDQASLSIPSGVHILLGKNGAGKTSFLKILSGYASFIGEGKIGGDILLQKSHRLIRQSVRFSEAEPGFPEFVRGQYLVDMFYKLLQGELEQIEEVKELLGIGEYLDQPIGTYSSGMKKKLSLLLAFIGHPQLILLDEPFNTLDPPTRANLCHLIQQKAAKDCSFFMALHQNLPLGHSIPIEGYWMIQDKQLVPYSEEELLAYHTP